MARRGEANFVAVRVGFWSDPHIMVLAQELRVDVCCAGAYVLRWEELVLAVGDARTGRVKGYSAQLIALGVGWKGRPAKLIEAFRRAGFLTSHRGTFGHPFWTETRTGWYALKRAMDAERHRAEENNATAFHGSSADAPRSGGGGSVSDPRKTQGSKDSAEAPEPAPQPPPGAGGGVGLTRWEWMLQHHDRPRNPGVCVRYLEAMDAQVWELVQWVVALRKNPGGVYIGRKKRVWGLSSDDFLRKAAYLEFHREWQEKLRAKAAPNGNGHGKQPEVVDLISNSEKFILAQLADDELSEAEKERIRQGWRSKHPNEVPPWEIA